MRGCLVYRYRKGHGIVSRCMNRARSSKQRTGSMLDNKDRRTCFFDTHVQKISNLFGFLFT